MTDIAVLTKALLSCEGNWRAAAQLLKASGAPEALVTVARPGILSGSTANADTSALAPYATVSASFLQSLRSAS